MESRAGLREAERPRAPVESEEHDELEDPLDSDPEEEDEDEEAEGERQCESTELCWNNCCC